MPSEQALQHVVRRGKNVAHIVKNGKAKALPQQRYRGLGKAKFKIVDELSGAANRKARVWIARSCLI